MSKKDEDKERFAAIPERALSDHRLSGIHFRALGIIALHDRGSEDGCWAKQKTMAEEVDVYPTHFSDAVKDLLVWTYIKAAKHAKDARRKVYRVMYRGEIVTEERNYLVTEERNEIPYNSGHEPIELTRQNTVHEASEQTPLTDPLIKGTDGAALEASKERGQAGRFVWVAGVEILKSLSLEEGFARKMVSRWLKGSGGNQERVMAAIEAAAEAGTRDPIPYVTAALKETPADSSAPLTARRRQDGKWDIPHGTDEYEAYRSKASRENSPAVYSFPDKPGHVAVCADRWPTRKAS
jgi:DNA-binding MarR family transcriptional regulator